MIMMMMGFLSKKRKEYKIGDKARSGTLQHNTRYENTTRAVLV